MRALDILTADGTPLHVVHLNAGETGYLPDRPPNRQSDRLPDRLPGHLPGHLPSSGEDADAVVQFFDARHRTLERPAGRYTGVTRGVGDLLATEPGDVLDADPDTDQGEPPLTTDNGRWRIDAAALGVVRRWLARAEPHHGLHHPHTLLSDLHTDVMISDVADLRAGDVVLAGGHLARRVIGPPVRARTGPDVHYRYPVARLTFPDGTPGDGPDRYTLFQAAEGTALLILRPTSCTGTSRRSVGPDRPNPTGPTYPTRDHPDPSGSDGPGGLPVTVLAVHDGHTLDVDVFANQVQALHVLRARYRVPSTVADEQVVEYLLLQREFDVTLTTVAALATLRRDAGDRPTVRTPATGPDRCPDDWPAVAGRVRTPPEPPAEPDFPYFSTLLGSRPAMDEHDTRPSPQFTITLGPGTSDTIRDCLHSIETAIGACDQARDYPDLAAQRQAVIVHMWSLLRAIGYTFLIGNRHDQDLHLFPDADRSVFFRFDSGLHGAMIYHPGDGTHGSWQVHT